MGTLHHGRLTKLVHAKHRAGLAEPDGSSAAAPAQTTHVVFVLVAEELHRKASDRRDFRFAVLARRRRQPVRPLVGEQQADVVLLGPDIDAAVAHGMELPRIPDQRLLVASLMTRR